MSDIKKGVVKWFDPQKGFGFITLNEGGDVFLHKTAVSDRQYRPQEGDYVLCKVKSDKRGPKAFDVRPDSEAVTAAIAKAPPQERPRDDRVTCGGCNRKIVPRMITNRGAPDRSVCPYCGTTYKHFFNFRWLWGLAIFLFVVFVIMPNIH